MTGDTLTTSWLAQYNEFNNLEEEVKADLLQTVVNTLTKISPSYGAKAALPAVFTSKTNGTEGIGPMIIKALKKKVRPKDIIDGIDQSYNQNKKKKKTSSITDSIRSKLNYLIKKIEDGITDLTDNQKTTTPNNLPTYKMFNSVERKMGDKSHTSKNNTEKSSSSSSSSSSNSSSSSGEKGKESNSNSSTNTDIVSNPLSKPDIEKP